MIFAVIPIRQASTRFKNKVIHPICGKPMFWHVYRNVVECPWVDGVCVAYPLDDAGIRLKCDEYKVPHVCSYQDHECGTDRVYEAVRRLGVKRGVVINVQGDEPLLNHGHIKALVDLFDEPKVKVGTLVYQADSGDDDDVKVQFDGTGRIFNFTRIDGSTPRYYKHIGVYGFKLGVLAEFVRLGPSEREKKEKIELLRCLDNGIPVHCAVCEPTVAVDRPEDIRKVEDRLR